MVKHLTIMHASLRYLKTRLNNVPFDEEKNGGAIEDDMLLTLTESYTEVNQLRQILKRMINQVNQVSKNLKVTRELKISGIEFGPPFKAKIESGSVPEKTSKKSKKVLVKEILLRFSVNTF